jgi:hypothetical protein
MLVTELKREPGDNPGRARRCDRGRPLHLATDLYDKRVGKAQQEGRSGSQKTCLNEEQLFPWTRDRSESSVDK